jgi:hypothetical protein
MKPPPLTVEIRVDIDGLSELLIDYRDYFGAYSAWLRGDCSLAAELGCDSDVQHQVADWLDGYRSALDERLEELVTGPLDVARTYR